MPGNQSSGDEAFAAATDSAMPGSQSSAVLEEMADGHIIYRSRFCDKGDSPSETVKGDDALVGVADLIFQATGLASQFATVDRAALALQLRTFLSSAFGGEWPEICPADAVSDEHCRELVGVMLEVLAEPLPLGEDPMICAMQALHTTLSGDARVVSFFDHIRAAEASAATETSHVVQALGQSSAGSGLGLMLPPPPPLRPEDRPMFVTIRDRSGQVERVKFKIKMTTPLRKLKEAYIERVGLQHCQVILYYYKVGTPRYSFTAVGDDDTRHAWLH